MFEHDSLPEAVARTLRRRILNNELPAETRLVEANLAAEFGVSRGTIRDGAMFDPVITYLYLGGLVSAMPLRMAT